MNFLTDEISKYRALIETVLIEAQNYEDMFNDIQKIVSAIPDDKFKTDVNAQIQDIVRRARAVLKKSDRVVWFLRLWKVGFLLHLVVDVQAIKIAEQDLIRTVGNQLNELIKRMSTDLARRGGYPEISKTELIKAYGNDTKLLTDLAHYLSLPIPAIQNYVFGFKSLTDIIDSFEDYEAAWKAKATELIPYDPTDGKTILKFPNGYFWQNLNRAYCRSEGNAMGHCGNTASYKSGDQVLSLRQFVKRGEEMYVRPSLTFILDRYGFLGEMKGRANKKPETKYHPYIVELLKLPMIEGIKGGGYAPEENFSINDLDDQTREELIDMKPTLGTLRDIYEKYGANSALFKNALDTKVGGSKLDYLDIDADTVIVESWSDFEEFIKDIGDDIVKYFTDIYFNDEYDDLLDIDADKIKHEDVFDLIEGLSTESYVKLMNRLGIAPAQPNDTARFRRSIIQAVDEFIKDPDLMSELTRAVELVLEKRKDAVELIKKETLDVINDYIDVGWSFETPVNLVINRQNIETAVKLEISLPEYVEIVSAEDDDDEYSYYRYHVEDRGWSTIDDYNTESIRKDADLPSQYNRKDTSNLKKLIDVSSLQSLNFKIFSNTFANLADLN